MIVITHSPPFAAKVKMSGAILCLPLCAFMAWTGTTLITVHEVWFIMICSFINYFMYCTCEGGVTLAPYDIRLFFFNFKKVCNNCFSVFHSFLSHMMTTYSVHLPSHFLDITLEPLMKNCNVYGDICGFLDHNAAHYVRTVNEKNEFSNPFSNHSHCLCLIIHKSPYN